MSPCQIDITCHIEARSAIGPNELSIRDPSAVQALLGPSGLQKGPRTFLVPVLLHSLRGYRFHWKAAQDRRPHDGRAAGYGGTLTPAPGLASRVLSGSVEGI